ncbi:hypothetical protein [Liquorilactobacillus satsumensis]|uniref:hypothetical protein n=1 Tax=Liquorilactobacillus satsumensis TaxID=259059 RepID=UPI000AB3D70B|nr:hypothetical protein [Liquorilactobacillus satsumensis]
MSVKIPASEFAIAVVNSSNPNLSIESKIELYEQAVKMVKEHNRNVSAPKLHSFN